MERRVFLSIVGAAGFVPQTSSGLLLTAFAAENLPQSAVLHGYQNPELIFELRRYEGSPPAPELLGRYGIRPIFEDRTSLLIPFADLTRRDEAWSALASDPEWQANRRDVTQISLYRASAPLRGDLPAASRRPPATLN